MILVYRLTGPIQSEYDFSWRSKKYEEQWNVIAKKKRTPKHHKSINTSDWYDLQRMMRSVNITDVR